MTVEKTRILFDPELEPGVDEAAEVFSELGEEGVYGLVSIRNKIFLSHYQKVIQEKGYLDTKEAESTRLFIDMLSEAIDRAKDILRKEGRDSHSLLQRKNQELKGK